MALTLTEKMFDPTAVQLKTVCAANRRLCPNTTLKALTAPNRSNFSPRRVRRRTISELKGVYDTQHHIGRLRNN